jgi:hypothetical protein
MRLCAARRSGARMALVRWGPWYWHRALAEPKTPRSLCGIVHFCFARCAPCLSSPAAASPIPRKRPGAFITATSRSARSRSALAIPGGSGRATFIQVAIHQNTQKAPPRPSTRRAGPSRSRGVSFAPSVTEADFDAYRRNRAFHTWRQAMGTAGLKLPTAGRLLLRCFDQRRRRGATHLHQAHCARGCMNSLGREGPVAELQVRACSPLLN